MALNTLWIFGDSFDFGSESSMEGYPYYDSSNKEESCHYSIHLGKKYNMNVINNGKPGHGPTYIIFNLAKELKNIKPNDYVIVGMSDSQRLAGFVKPLPSHPSNYKHGIRSLSYWSKDDYSLKGTMDHISPNYFDIIEKYVVTCMTSTLGEHTAFNHSIVKWMLESTGCKKSFTYHPDIWNNFETIQTATNGEIDDMHWSHKGNKDFSEFIDKKWEKNNHVHLHNIQLNKRFDLDGAKTIYWSPEFPDNDPYNNPIDFKRDRDNKENFLVLNKKPVL